MNIHEYQGKAILARFGVSVPEGIVIDNTEKAEEAANEITGKTGATTWVVKAQIHAGGRGKGGGVKLARNIEEVNKHTASILGMQLVTPQTGAEGKKVHKVLIQQDIYYPGEKSIKEYYMSILL